MEIKELLKKCTIMEVELVRDQLMSAHYFCGPRKKNFRPIINLKNLNQFLPYQKFLMEGLKQMKDLIRPGNVMIKIDLKDVYFNIPLHPALKKL